MRDLWNQTAALNAPPAFRARLEWAIEEERAAGGDAAALIAHYTQTMPAMCEAQRAHRLFRRELAWERMPRLGNALNRLDAILADAGVAYRAPREARTLAELFAGTHYGGCMPMLYGYPADLAYIEAHAGEGDVVDRMLAAPIVHEVCHLDRARTSSLPLHLDECIGGYLGVLVHPEFAYPAPGAQPNDAIFAAPWLAQVGQAIVRAFGLRATVRAYAGLEPLPGGLTDAARALADADWRARRSLHLLADTLAPEPWLALLPPPPPDPEADRAIAHDALRAMCLATDVIAGSLRTRVADFPITVEIDPVARCVRSGAQRYHVPFPTDARTVTIDELAAIPDLVDRYLGYRAPAAGTP